MIIQLHHDRKTKVVVKSSWILEYGKIRPTITTTGKQAHPAFFYYNEDASSKQTFTTSAYAKVFEPSTASVYKGYITNKIYCECHICRNV